MTESLSVDPIIWFRGDHQFLSNFDVHEPFTWRGREFDCGERAFAWAKGLYLRDTYLNDLVAYEELIFGAKTPGEAKKVGRTAPIDVAAWDAQKVWLMREITHEKFGQVPGYAGRLINTGCGMLIEGNDWGDKFWGRVYNDKTNKWEGKNVLGVILMEERGYWSKGDRP